jgi:hypothetical protein
MSSASVYPSILSPHIYLPGSIFPRPSLHRASASPSASNLVNLRPNNRQFVLTSPSQLLPLCPYASEPSYPMPRVARQASDLVSLCHLPVCVHVNPKSKRHNSCECVCLPLPNPVTEPAHAVVPTPSSCLRRLISSINPYYLTLSSHSLLSLSLLPPFFLATYSISQSDATRNACLSIFSLKIFFC